MMWNVCDHPHELSAFYRRIYSKEREWVHEIIINDMSQRFIIQKSLETCTRLCFRGDWTCTILNLYTEYQNHNSVMFQLHTKTAFRRMLAIATNVATNTSMKLELSVCRSLYYKYGTQYNRNCWMLMAAWVYSHWANSKVWILKTYFTFSLCKTSLYSC